MKQTNKMNILFVYIEIMMHFSVIQQRQFENFFKQLYNMFFFCLKLTNQFKLFYWEFIFDIFITKVM